MVVFFFYSVLYRNFTVLLPAVHVSVYFKGIYVYVCSDVHVRARVCETAISSLQLD